METRGINLIVIHLYAILPRRIMQASLSAAPTCAEILNSQQKWIKGKKIIDTAIPRIQHP